MQKQKDNSNIYALVVIILIAVIIAGAKMKDLNFEWPAEQSQEITTEIVEPVYAVDSMEISEPEAPLQYLLELDGKYASAAGLLRDPAVEARLRTLIGTVRLSQMNHHWGIETPIYIEDGILVAKGCQQDNCEITNFALMIDVVNDVIFAGVKIEGVTEVFSENASIIMPLERWKMQNESPEPEVSSTFTSDPDFSAVINYYNDISNNNFNANRYFAETVKHYLNFDDIAPSEINQIRTNEAREYRNQQFSYDTNTFEYSESVDEIHYYAFLLESKRYSISKKRNENSEIQIEVGFNSSGQIASLKNLRTESMIYTN